MSMEGKVVAITGGASGIGLATAKLLASRGAKVSVADVHQQERLDKAAAEIEQSAPNKDNVTVSKCDVRDAAQVATWLKNTVDNFGRLDHVANIAGVWNASSVEELDEQAWDYVIGVNLTGAMHVLRESLKLLPSNAGCSIVIVASICGLTGFATQAAYCASKHGVIGLARCAAKDLGDRGIRVNCVAPGAVKTPMVMDGPGVEFLDGFASQTPVGRPGDPAEIARLIAFLLGEESSFVTGSVYTIDGGHLC